MPNPASTGGFLLAGQAKHSSALMGRLKSSFAAGGQSPSDSSTSAQSPLTRPQPLQTPLDVVEEVLDEVEKKQTQPVSGGAVPGAVAQAIPSVVDQAVDTLNPPAAATTTTFKETAQPGTLDQAVVDAMPGVQVVEHEVAPEIPVEVESFVERAETSGHLPQEITIAGDQVSTTPIQKVSKQPVIVLPISEETEKKGARKGLKFSIRWLVEWSRKIMKMFVGRVVYKEA